MENSSHIMVDHPVGSQADARYLATSAKRVNHLGRVRLSLNWRRFALT